MITQEQAQTIKTRFATYELARKSYDPKGYVNGRSYDSRQQLEIERMSGTTLPTNQELSSVEVFEFANSAPKSFYAYVNKSTNSIETFNGDFLGNVVFGKEHKYPAFNKTFSKRVPIKVNAINGLTYYGVWYKSSGNYARLKVCSKDSIKTVR